MWGLKKWLTGYEKILLLQMTQHSVLNIQVRHLATAVNFSSRESLFWPFTDVFKYLPHMSTLKRSIKSFSKMWQDRKEPLSPVGDRGGGVGKGY